jgi:hypothetical protein
MVAMVVAVVVVARDEVGGDQVDRSSAWSRQRAIQPVGVTDTAMRRPQSGQKRGGSRSRPHPGHSVVDRPQLVQ